MALGLWSMMSLAVALGVYLIPTIIALVRKPASMAGAIVVNIFLGWSLIGWVVALVLALGQKRQDPHPYGFYPAGPYQQSGGYPAPGVYHQGYGTPAPQQYALPPASSTQQPAWGTPSSLPYGAYAPEVTDAPPSGNPPPGSFPPPA